MDEGVARSSVHTGGARPADPNAAVAEHLRLVLDASGLGTFHWDKASGQVTWDSRLEELFGLAPGTFGGTFDAWVALLSPDDRPDVLRRLEDAIAAKGRYTVDHRVIWPDGSVHWLQGTGQITVDEDGAVTGSIGCTRDLTAQKHDREDLQRLADEAVEAAEQERQHRERLEFLTRVNEALAAAVSRDQLMTNVVWTAVPRLGDWCSIHVLPSPDALEPVVEVAHLNPDMRARARQMIENMGYDPDAERGVARIIRTGESMFHGVLDKAAINHRSNSPAQRDMALALELRSAIGVPLLRRGRVLGALVMIRAGAGCGYTKDDLTLAEAVAARIASSLDNLRLTDEQRRIATTLQASLLPGELPDIPGVDVAVRYWAAGSGVEVGGDFYDVFRVRRNIWAVVMGDVCGTGPAAAAVTALARHTIASAAWHGDDHGQVLENLNRAMVERDAGPFCTAIYGTLEPDERGATFTFASGGHPLPVVATACGEVETRGTPGTLIGAFNLLRTTDTTAVRLLPGDTVVLYTDGATDVPDPDGLSAEEFQNLVAGAVSGADDAEMVADRLHERLSAIRPVEQRSDDIALLVLRVRERAGVDR
jgi:PAS domain S-box-containing protein